ETRAGDRIAARPAVESESLPEAPSLGATTREAESWERSKETPPYGRRGRAPKQWRRAAIYRASISRERQRPHQCPSANASRTADHRHRQGSCVRRVSPAKASRLGPHQLRSSRVRGCEPARG